MLIYIQKQQCEKIVGLTNPYCKMRMCVDTKSSVGYIGTASEYFSWMPLYINTEGATGNLQKHYQW